jgi:hypothetical protein
MLLILNHKEHINKVSFGSMQTTATPVTEDAVCRTRKRRQTAEHPFGTLKAGMGSTYFLDDQSNQRSGHHLENALVGLAATLLYGSTPTESRMSDRSR